MSGRRRLRVILFFEGAAVGIFTGVIIAAVRFFLDAADFFRPIWFSNFFDATKIFCTVAGLIFVAIFLSKSIQFDRQVAGSGIPQIKKILHDKATMTKNPLRLVFIKFFAMILGIGAGMSLGRAGVSVQFGACVGNFLSKIFFVASKFHKYHGELEGKILLTAGAGAGLAAIFNAPLAGVIFCAEELHRKFSPEILSATLTASVSASAVVEIFFGVRPLFCEMLNISTNLEKIFEPQIFFCVILFGIFSGAFGAIFTKLMIFSLYIYDKLKILGAKRFLIPLLLIIPIGINFPQILGCGNFLVDELLREKFFLATLIILFVGKFLFTLICFGTNAPGGVFLPVLTLGALGGNIFASIGVEFGFFSADEIILFTIFGMAAYLAAVIKAPITGSVLIVELTGQFSYLLALTILSAVAFIISDLLGGKPIFSAIGEYKSPR